MQVIELTNELNNANSHIQLLSRFAGPKENEEHKHLQVLQI